MARKFKLIKEYPNSCGLGTIFTQHDERSNDFYADQTLHGGKVKTYSTEWNLDYFVKNTEFFEEIVEKDYEILSFIANKNRKGITEGDIISLNKDNIFSGNSKDFIKISGSLSEALNSDVWNIHSVKRLSDGEVFTVGDKIEGYDNTGIKEIKLFEHGLRVITDANGKGVVTDKLAWDLKSCKKAKTPLFTTEDGVDIYEGDTIYSVFSNYIISTDIAGKYKNSNSEHPVEHWCRDDKYFSTKEAAEEYVLMNKPCLSINGVMTSQDGLIFAEKKLKQLVKSRL